MELYPSPFPGQYRAGSQRLTLWMLLVLLWMLPENSCFSIISWTQSIFSDLICDREVHMLLHNTKWLEKYSSTYLTLDWNLNPNTTVPTWSLPVRPSTTVCLEFFPALVVVSTTLYSAPGLRPWKLMPVVLASTLWFLMMLLSWTRSRR